MRAISVTLLVAVVGAVLAVVLHFVLRPNVIQVQVAYIIHNATIYTAEPKDINTAYGAMAVSVTGEVVALGQSLDTLQSLYPNANLTNLNGYYVYPGFTDAHAHLLNQGTALSQANLVGSQSPEEVVERLAPFANKTEEGAWLLARGWDQTLFPTQEFPDRSDLDGDYPSLPIALTRIDGHACWINTAALDLLGTLPSIDPPGGHIVRDPNTGEPTGIFVDNAMDLVFNKVPPLTSTQIYNNLQSAFAECVKYGLTSVHDAGNEPEVIDEFLRSSDNNQLPIRVNLMTQDHPTNTSKKRGKSTEHIDDNHYHEQDVHNHGAGIDDDPIAYWCKRGKIPNYKNRYNVFVNSAKIYIDGALGSRGAALLSPYSDDPNSTGLLITQPDVFNEHVIRWMTCGFQVCTHAIGDRGNRVVLDGYENAFKHFGIPLEPSNSQKSAKDYQLRVEHSQIVTPEDRLRFKAMGLVASMQPTHATSDMGWAEDRLGPDRIKNAYTWKDFQDLGVLLALGSDFPVELVNPLLGFYAAITRQDIHGNPPGGWYSNQCLSRYETLQGMTIQAAKAGFIDAKLGSLAPGKYADYTVLEKDIMTIQPIQIPTVKVVQTVVGGKAVYQA